MMAGESLEGGGNLVGGNKVRVEGAEGLSLLVLAAQTGRTTSTSLSLYPFSRRPMLSKERRLLVILRTRHIYLFR